MKLSSKTKIRLGYQTIALLSSGFLASTVYADLTTQDRSTLQIQQQSAKQFADASAQLYQVTSQCQQNHLQLDDARMNWRQVMSKWMALQGQTSAPVDAISQSWNVQFWPDKKNITGQKMQLLLKQPELWSKEGLATQSVTVQGVGAIEWLLWDQGSPLLHFKEKQSSDLMDTRLDYCHLLIAVNDKLNQTSTQIATAWQDNPWNSYGEQQWRQESVSLLSHQLDFVMSKLTRPLAKVGKPRPYFSESWRSQTSLEHIRDNLDAMQRLYLASDGLNQLLIQVNENDLARKIGDQFKLIQETYPQQASLFALLAPQDKAQTKEGYKAGLHLKNQLEQLAYLINDEASVALGVSVGFNSTDGD